MIVDGNADRLVLQVESLRRRGHAPIPLTDINAAPRQASERLPSVIWLELMADGMSMFEIARAIRKYPASRHIPILARLARNDIEERETAFALGIDDILSIDTSVDAIDDRLAELSRLGTLYEEAILRAATAGTFGIESGFDPATSDESAPEVILLARDRRRLDAIKAEIESMGLHALPCSELAELETKLAEFGPEWIILDGSWKAASDALASFGPVFGNDDDTSTPIVRLLADIEDGGCARLRFITHRRANADALRGTLFETLREATSDTVEGVYGLPFLLAHLDRLIDISASREKPLTLLTIRFDDLDGSNRRLDTVTRADLLKRAATGIRSTLRRENLIARVDRNTLAIILGETASKGAKITLARLDQHLTPSGVCVTGHHRRDFQLTHRGSVATLHEGDDRAAAFLQRALHRLEVGEPGRSR